MQPQPSANGHRPTRAQKDAASRRQQEALAEARAQELTILVQKTHDLERTCQALVEALNARSINVTVQEHALLAVALGAALGDDMIALRVQVAILAFQANEFRSALMQADEIVAEGQARAARAALLDGLPTTERPSGLVVPGS